MRSIFSPFKMVSCILIASLFMCLVQASDWTGGIITAANSNVDTDFFITNTNIIEGPVRIAAVAQDVTVTVGPDAVLISGVAAKAGQIFITAAADRTVFFVLDDADLTFLGSFDGITRLLVSFSGEGSLVFQLSNGKKVAFDRSEDPLTAGTNLYVTMSSKENILPVILFERVDTVSTENVEVRVGRDSTMTYLVDRTDMSPIDAEGAIAFAPVSSNPSGSMILRILDGGSVNIAGHLVTKNPLGEFSNQDVDLKSLAGRQAQFLVSNVEETNTARLTVINSNRIFPHLKAEPFCDNSFTGYLPGFVLGANGILAINNASYLDYVSCALNTCPGAYVCDLSEVDLADLDLAKARCVDKSKVTRGSCVVSLDDDDLDVDDLLSSLDLHIPPCNVCGVTDGGCECVQFCRAADSFIKVRNPSALFVDGLNRAQTTLECFTTGTCQRAVINLVGCSGLYFRSGVDNCGECNEADGFIINPMGEFDMLATRGVGNIVFDVEGELVVTGSSANASALRLLSAQVAPTGCPVVIASECACPTLNIFPALTHNKSFDGEFLRYNKGAFLINNRLNLFNATLLHTDDNHHILERDDLDRGDPRIFSEPTYIGGEFKQACKADAPRPAIALYNSIIRFHESAGFTGVDIQVPNDPMGNMSGLRFYSNGPCVDRGNGRIVLLGTNHGDRSCRTCKVVDHNSHLDVFQTTNQETPSDQILRLTTSLNDPCFTLSLTATVSTNQASIQTIYLGNESNISVGTAPGLPPFTVATRPTFIIDGAYFSFETQGGSAYLPELAGTLGEGGIFVDTNGVFRNENRFRANISTMVTRSGNGEIDLPQTEVFFDSRVGVTDWQPTMTVDNILVKPGESFSDFTIDWMQVITDCTAFIPYDPKMTPLLRNIPPVTEANLTLLPTILGTVDQLQVKRSRLGDQISLEVGPGGFVRELVFLNGFNSAEAAMGTIVVNGWGRVGLGSAKRNYDSNDANIVLGINGITVIAKGDGVIELNEDIIINNVCHILPGPNFGAEGTQTLVFFSDDEKEFRIKSTGVLDLSEFKGRNQLVEFGGNMRFVFEPGAKLLLSNELGDENRTRVRFTDTVSINFERVFDTNILRADEPNREQKIDNRLVKFIGNGDVTMKEGATLLLPNDTFLAIETDVATTGTPGVTDIVWNLNDQATFNVGDINDLGGTFQVGNRTDMPDSPPINFTLIIDGIGSQFQIRRQGLVLFGVGGVQVFGNFPNNWTYQPLFNVGNITIDIRQGTFTHNQIFEGNNKLASLMVLGGNPATTTYNFIFNVVDSSIQGGGNFALVPTPPAQSPFQIMVNNFNGQLPGSNANVGLFSSKDLLRDTQVFPQGSPFMGPQAAIGRNPADMFNYLSIRSHEEYGSPKATIAQQQLNTPVLGFITNQTEINRMPNIRIIGGQNGNTTDASQSLRRGSVFINVDDSSCDINNVVEIEDQCNM